MKKIDELIKKSVYTIKHDGVFVCLRKIRNYIIIHATRDKGSEGMNPEKIYGDVLFINGCFLPHPYRYRVSHQREQLCAANISNNEVFYENITLDMVKNYRIFIFFRCLHTDKVEEFIMLAKKLNKVVLFDIDDLVIDRKYTDTIQYLDTMSVEDREEYDSGVERIKKTLLLCDGAITTTERLAEELKNYVPEVFINRNTASDLMVYFSEEELMKRYELPYRELKDSKSLSEKIEIKNARKKMNLRKNRGIRLGYFSGSTTHNEDFNMIQPVILRLMEEYHDMELHIVGELDVPVEFKVYKNRVVIHPFISWKGLPHLISSVDINLAPLKWSVFNEAKSENKWIEAALVKVPTVAGRVGAFEKMIQHGETGYLCNTQEEWYHALKELIDDPSLRSSIAENAYTYVKKNCTTIYQSHALGKYILSKMKPNIAMILPSLHISGGVMVAIKHCCILKKAGYDVIIINQGVEQENVFMDGIEIPVISDKVVTIEGLIDKGVATLWATVNMFKTHSNILNRYYLVQSFETNFGKYGDYSRIRANQTYHFMSQLNYITISKWCQQWLKDDYEKESRYAPNGIDLSKFIPVKRIFKGKIRILVEGNPDDYFKNVDESFRIVDQLDKEKYEINFLSYLGKPKPEYYVDNFYHNIPHEKVGKIYQESDILIKSSILESFSYPPLEMMATGGYVVVTPNEGNIEYLTDNENCLFYERGNIEMAVKAIEKISEDKNLREKLYKNGLVTAENHNWENIKEDIVRLYD